MNPREPLLKSEILQLLRPLGKSSLSDRQSSLMSTHDAGTIERRSKTHSAI